MVLDKFDLKMLFHDMIKLAVEDMRAPQSESARMGFGCKKLLYDITVRHNPLLDRIMGDYSSEGHEYRLNESGLKMVWRMEKHFRTGERMFLATICGDQAKDYKVLTEQLMSLLKQRDAQKWAYDDRRREWERRQDEEDE